MKPIKDENLLKEIRAAILISNAMGSLETIREMEPAKHTRRSRKLLDAYKALDEVLTLYAGKALEYDLMKLATIFYDETIDERLNQLIMQGLALDGDAVIACERWAEGDVLELNGEHVEIIEVKDNGYNYKSGPMLLYSETNFPKDPFMITWRKVCIET